MISNEKLTLLSNLIYYQESVAKLRQWVANLSHDMTKSTKLVCAQRRLRSAWASA